MMPVAMIADTARAAASSDMKSASSVRTASGFRDSRTVIVERDAEAALRSDERADEIVAVGFAVRVAERDDLAVREQHA